MKQLVISGVLVGLLSSCSAQQPQYATKADLAAQQEQMSKLTATSTQHEKVLGLVVPYLNAHERILARARDKKVGIAEAYDQLLAEKQAAEVQELEQKAK